MEALLIWGSIILCLCTGERPDTVHISDLPCKWFVEKHSSSASHKPSQEVVSDILSQFGDIRCMDIPILDPYRCVRLPQSLQRSPRL